MQAEGAWELIRMVREEAGQAYSAAMQGNLEPTPNILAAVLSQSGTLGLTGLIAEWADRYIEHAYGDDKPDPRAISCEPITVRRRNDTGQPLPPYTDELCTAERNAMQLLNLYMRRGPAAVLGMLETLTLEQCATAGWEVLVLVVNSNMTMPHGYALMSEKLAANDGPDA